MYHILASSNAHYLLGNQLFDKSNLKKPACASKQDVLELATLRYVVSILNGLLNVESLRNTF